MFDLSWSTVKNLDFLIIGAQKCATTALHELLRNHPDIAMPLEKEVPFFTGAEQSEQAWQSFASDQFGVQNSHKLWGKASPQYMCDPMVPARIGALMPSVKLVAILRDPIDRTLSHFRMGQRRETESRTFPEAVRPLLGQDKPDRAELSPVPDHATGYQSEAEFYVAWSEYGRSLAAYLQHFKSEQLLILYTEDLEQKPEATLDRLLEYIGLPQGYRPGSLGSVVHGGGTAKRIPNSVRYWLRRRRAVSRLWALLPEKQRGRLRFQYEQWNIRKESNQEPVPDSLRKQLSAHYAADLRTLMSLPLSISPPPWLDRYEREI